MDEQDASWLKRKEEKRRVMRAGAAAVGDICDAGLLHPTEGLRDGRVVNEWDAS